MEGNTLILSPSSYKTPVIFVLVRSLGDGPQAEWFNFVRDFTNDRLNHLSGGNLPRRTYIQFIMYCRGSLVSVVPTHILGGNDVVEEIPFDDTTQDMVALYGFESIIKIVENFQEGPKQDPNEQFSYHLWHIAAAEYPHFDVSPAPWDPKWNLAYGELMRLDIELLTILINSCPELQQLFSARTHIPPWVNLCNDCPHHAILPSGFVPSSERRGNAPLHDLHGVMPFTVTAGHPILSSSMPSAIVGVTLLHSPHISAAHGSHYMTDDWWSGPPIYQCTGSGSHMHVPATGQVLNPHESPQSFSPAVVQIQPQFNSIDMHVHGAQGLARVHSSVSRDGSGIEQQQPMPHDQMGAFNVSGSLANTNTGNTMLWTGTLEYLNGVCAQARAPATEAVGNPMLSAWPKEFYLEFVAAPNLSTLDIQAWMYDTKAAVVRLRCMDGADNWHFDQLLQALRNSRSYAIVRWEDQGVALERLLLVPVGNILLCAAFPDKGVPGRPKPQPRRQIRVLPGRKRASSGPQPDPAATETPPDGPHVEAAESTITPTQSQPEQPQVTHCDCDQNTDACSIGSSADSSLGDISIIDLEEIEEYEYVDSDDEST